MAPDQTPMRRSLAEALVRTNQLDEAEAELAICVQQAPNDAQIRYVSRQNAYDRGDFDQARERLARTLDLAPNHLDARCLLGQLDLADGKLDSALRELQAVVDRQPQDTFAREALGRTSAALGRTDEAKEHLDYVAKAEAKLRELDRLLRESIAQPKDAEIRFAIGSILLRYGAPDDGARWIRAALELNPDHVEAQRVLAGYLQQRRQAGSSNDAPAERGLGSAETMTANTLRLRAWFTAGAVSSLAVCVVGGCACGPTSSSSTGSPASPRTGQRRGNRRRVSGPRRLDGTIRRRLPAHRRQFGQATHHGDGLLRPRPVRLRRRRTDRRLLL